MTTAVQQTERVAEARHSRLPSGKAVGCTDLLGQPVEDCGGCDKCGADRVPVWAALSQDGEWIGLCARCVPLRCEARREKPARYLSNRNPLGVSYQKCGKKAVTKSQFGKLLCAKCARPNDKLSESGGDKPTT